MSYFILDYCICRKLHAAFIETLTNAMLEEDTSGSVKGYSMACRFKLPLMARQAHRSVHNLFIQKLARSRTGYVYCTSICCLYLVVYADFSHIYPQYKNILSLIIGVCLATYCCGIKFYMAWSQSFSCSLRSWSCKAQWKTAIFSQTDGMLIIDYQVVQSKICIIKLTHMTQTLACNNPTQGRKKSPALANINLARANLP